MLKLEVQGRRTVGRPNLSFIEVMMEDMRVVDVNGEDKEDMVMVFDDLVRKRISCKILQ